MLIRYNFVLKAQFLFEAVANKEVWPSDTADANFVTMGVTMGVSAGIINSVKKLIHMFLKTAMVFRLAKLTVMIFFVFLTKDIFFLGVKLTISTWNFQVHKVGCVFAMVVVSILPQAEFGPNDHRQDAPHFNI